MLDSNISYSINSVKARQTLLALSSEDPNQKDIKSKFRDIREHFWWNGAIILDNAVIYRNAEQVYQIEWNLCLQGKILGTLVFGRKLPTIYGQSPLRKFWIRRNNNAEFGDCTAGQFINTELYDSLYFHDHGEALRLNQYSYGDGDTIYRHESANQKNPGWHYVSPANTADEV